MENPLPDQEAQLLQILEQRAIVNAETIERLQAEQVARREAAQNKLAGTLYAIDLAQRKLIIQDALSGTFFKEILLTDTAIAADVVAPALTGLHLSWVDPANGNSIGHLEWQPSPLYGLIVTPEQSFIYPPQPLAAEQLPASTYCLCPAPYQDVAYDLYLDEDSAYLLIVDRDAGQIQVLSTETQQILGTVSVRPQGLKRALNLAFDGANGCVYLTDNQAFMLYCLQLPSLKLEKIDIGMGGYALGNLALSPDGQHLFILTLKPTESLLFFDLESHELIKDIPFKGNLYSGNHGAPYDLLTLTPDLEHLLLMTCLEEEGAEPLPLISVFDAERGKTLQRYSLRDLPHPPHMLAFPFANNLGAYQKSIIELLLEEGLVTRSLLASLQTVDMDGPDAPDQGQGLVPTLVPLPAAPITLPPEQALPVILDLLADKFYQQTEITIQNDVEAWGRLQAEAELTRQFLQDHDAADIQINALFGRYDLRAWLSRADLLMQIEQRQREAEANRTPPEKCPSCQTFLHQAWECASCGLELDSPERVEQKAQSSLPAYAHLPQFHVLLADSLRRRLVLLDQNRTLDWVMEEEALGSIVPWNVLKLANKNLLVLDRDNNQLFECGPSGQIKWTLPQKTPESQLQQPFKVCLFVQNEKELFLVVDQGNHRVVAMDRAGELVWQYGQTEVAGPEDGHLDLPSHMQWTSSDTCLISDTGNNRVLEVNRADGQVLRCMGEEIGLFGPVYAERLSNQNTLIVDAGNYRVLELDPEGDLVNECFYFREEMGEAMRMDLPVHVMRGEKQNLILVDEEKIVELLPNKRRIIWSSLLDHLAQREEITEDVQGAGEQYTQSFYQYKMPSMEELISRLRKNENQQKQLDALNARLMANFQRLLEVRREMDALRAQRSKVKQIKETESHYPLYSIDRTHHYVMLLDRKGKASWHFGGDAKQKLLRPQQISETEEDTLLITDTGNQRVLEVLCNSQDVLLTIGGKDQRLLNQPRSAFRTLGGHTLIADQGNRRLVEISKQGQIIWEYKNLVQIVSPYFACEQGTGTILFADWALQMVKEISRDGTLIWSYGQSRRVGNGPNQLSSPEYAVRLASGATLIADTHNDRVIEVAPNRQILWQYTGTESIPLPHPSFCKRLPNGNTLIAFDNYRQLVEVDPEGSPCWHFELGNLSLVR
ncbi:MAG: hypothetical protein AB7I41_07220 [Candidatus Sericytochromatia bacterium]